MLPPPKTGDQPSHIVIMVITEVQESKKNTQDFLRSRLSISKPSSLCHSIWEGMSHA